MYKDQTLIDNVWIKRQKLIEKRNKENPNSKYEVMEDSEGFCIYSHNDFYVYAKSLSGAFAIKRTLDAHAI